MKNNYLFIGILIVLSVVLMSFNQTKVDKGYVVEANPKFKNLKVLPKDISEEGLDAVRSEEHTSELQSRGHLVCRLLLEKKKPSSDIRRETARIHPAARARVT